MGAVDGRGSAITTTMAVTSITTFTLVAATAAAIPATTRERNGYCNIPNNRRVRRMLQHWRIVSDSDRSRSCSIPCRLGPRRATGHKLAIYFIALGHIRRRTQRVR